MSVRWPRRLLELAVLPSALAVTSPALAQIPAYFPPESGSPGTSEPVGALGMEPEPEPELPRPARVAAPPSQARAASPAAKTALITERRPEPAAPDSYAAASDEAVRSRRRWYGWQTLIADGATLATLLGAAAAGSAGKQGDALAAPLSVLGVAGYEFAPGIVHFAHKNPGRGFASFGMRIGLPLAGGFIGASAASGCDGFLCEAGGAAIGVLVGVGAAIAIDAAVFAYEDPKLSSSPRVKLVPQLAFARGGAVFGLRGEL